MGFYLNFNQLLLKVSVKCRCKKKMQKKICIQFWGVSAELNNSSQNLMDYIVKKISCTVFNKNSTFSLWSYDTKKRKAKTTK